MGPYTGPRNRTRPRDAVGRYALWGLVTLLATSYVGSLFSPPPPSLRALAIMAMVFGWLFVGWAGWGDRHREGVVGRHDATL